MKKLARLFLLCLLMLAIPIQGIAAATMLFCEAGHHHAAAEQGEPLQHQHRHHHDADAKADQADQADQISSAAGHHQSLAKMVKDKCSSCAACCIGAALVTAFADSAISSPSSEKIDLVFSSHLGHVSDGLERPPRA
ncbi:hypothetical protein [Undibacterium sp.]|jgi:hypothetical protein|uniref:hypothetical protein n=1 Tax=Undibacterium sp. TaxID=1914977 RepID=UPI002CC20A94|nr:hypothetical protein [Undibacterium sp.]HTD05510.1 hypothetical protein [Undibacterium sp.]